MSENFFGLHVVGTTHIREAIEEQGLEVEKFQFTCRCPGCCSIYENKPLFESVVLAICKDMRV